MHRGNGIVVNAVDNQNHYKIIDHHHPLNDCLGGRPATKHLLRGWRLLLIVRDRGEKKMPVTYPLWWWCGANERIIVLFVVARPGR